MTPEHTHAHAAIEALSEALYSIRPLVPDFYNAWAAAEFIGDALGHIEAVIPLGEALETSVEHEAPQEVST